MQAQYFTEKSILPMPVRLCQGDYFCACNADASMLST